MAAEAGARSHAAGGPMSPWLVFLLLAAATFAVFSPLLSADFINYDDQMYVTENSRVQAGLTWENVKWAFTTLYFGFYYPLSWLSHMLDCQMYGLWAGGHHLTSVLIHAGSAMVLLLSLLRMTGSLWRSAFVSALFALHPLHVESVAWISERKDVLSTLFLMLMLLFYARYAESPSSKRYIPVVILFLLGLMAKSMIVTAPVLLLLLDVWPLGRWGARGNNPSSRVRLVLLLEKLPLFALSGIFVLLTILSQRRIGALSTLEALPLWTRVQNALLAFMGYLYKTVWPVGLALPYPYQTRDLPAGRVVLSALLVVSMTTLALLSFKKRPYLLVGFAWFASVLLPVIGILQVGSQPAADRYTYVSLIGIFIAATWWLSDLASDSKAGRSALTVAALITLAILGALTWAQATRWKDSISLFSHTLRVTSDNALAQANLGTALLGAGRLDEAEERFKAAVKIKPDLVEVWGGLGDLFQKRGKTGAAQQCYERVLFLEPGNAKALNQQGLLLERQGRPEEAMHKYKSCIASTPFFLPARFNLARLLLEKGDSAAAVEEYRQIAGFAPYSSRAQYLLGKSLALQGRDAEAQPRFKRAIELDPDLVEARAQLGLLYARAGRLADAGLQMRAALERSPEDPDIRYLYAKIQLASGDRNGAAASLREALRLKPEWPEAKRLLASAESAAGGQ